MGSIRGGTHPENLGGGTVKHQFRLSSEGGKNQSRQPMQPQEDSSTRRGGLGSSERSKKEGRRKREGIQLTIQEVETLKQDITVLKEYDTDLRNVLSWIEPGAGIGDFIANLARDPLAYSPLRRITTMLLSHTEWKPEADAFETLQTPEELSKSAIQNLEEVAEALSRRELIQKRLLERVGSTRFEVRLGKLTPLEFALDNIIFGRSTRLSLWDTVTFGKKAGKEPGEKVGEEARVKLGMIDVDYDSTHDRMTVYLIQDEVEVEPSTFKPPDKKPKPYTVAATRQRKIRERVREGRNIPADRYEHETSGVEELMVHAAAHVLVQAGLLTENATITIPKPEVTPWGVITHTFLSRSIGEAVLHQPPNIHTQLDNIIKGNIYTESVKEGAEAVGDAVFSTVTHRFKENDPQQEIRNAQGKIQPLHEYVVALLISQIEDRLKPTEEELRQFDIDNPGGFRGLTNMLGFRTNAYLSAFHAYRTAFADVPSENTPIGRDVKRRDLSQLPFANNITISSVV